MVAEKKELAGVIAEPYSSADFLHCPIAMVKVDFPIFTAVPDGKAYPPLFELLRTPYTERQVGIFSVTDREEVIRLSRASVRLPVRIPERLTPMVSVVPAQLFSYHLTRHKGLDPDHPVGLTKVTKTC